mmetsp:Transcript_29909/g.61492  ORF Transcript_29909/g.61492 Transcript_29909/m.61492 type:complete len:217 (-) Transcript_29909:589-1239(-)
MLMPETSSTAPGFLSSRSCTCSPPASTLLSLHLALRHLHLPSPIPLLLLPVMLVILLVLRVVVVVLLLLLLLRLLLQQLLPQLPPPPHSPPPPPRPTRQQNSPCRWRLDSWSGDLMCTAPLLAATRQQPPFAQPRDASARKQRAWPSPRHRDYSTPSSTLPDLYISQLIRKVCPLLSTGSRSCSTSGVRESSLARPCGDCPPARAVRLSSHLILRY